MKKLILLLVISFSICFNIPLYSQTDSLFCKFVTKLSKGKIISSREYIFDFLNDDLRILKNSIITRHGCRFNSIELNYFYGSGASPCGIKFIRNKSYSDELLSDTDKINITNILKIINTPRFIGKIYDTKYEDKIFGIDLPTNIQNLISIFGRTKYISVPDPENQMPLGQKFKWKIKINLLS